MRHLAAFGLILIISASLFALVTQSYPVKAVTQVEYVYITTTEENMTIPDAQFQVNNITFDPGITQRFTADQKLWYIDSSLGWSSTPMEVIDMAIGGFYVTNTSYLIRVQMYSEAFPLIIWGGYVDWYHQAETSPLVMAMVINPRIGTYEGESTLQPVYWNGSGEELGLSLVKNYTISVVGQEFWNGNWFTNWYILFSSEGVVDLVLTYDTLTGKNTDLFPGVGFTVEPTWGEILPSFLNNDCEWPDAYNSDVDESLWV